MQKIKDFVYQYFPIVICLCVSLFGAIYILCRGDYGYHLNDDSGVERVQDGLERADEGLADATGELSNAQSGLDRAAADANGIADQVRGLTESTRKDQGLIDESSNIVGRSTERNQKVQSRISEIEKRNGLAQTPSQTGEKTT